VQRLTAAGLRAIELGANVSVGSTTDWAALRAGRDLLVHNYFPPPSEPFVLNLASPDAGIRARSIRLVADALALSAELGAPFYSVHGGFITDPTGFGTTSFVFPQPAEPDARARAMDRFCDSLAACVRRASALGVLLLVENNVCPADLKGTLLLQDADEFEQMLARFAPRELGVLLDTGHLNVSARTYGFDPLACARRLADRIRALHVHDNDGLADLHQPVTPSSWVMRVIVDAQLSQVPIVVEAKFEAAAALREHVEWLAGATVNSGVL
jgi:sugar phosphate isomerase/epimerase